MKSIFANPKIELEFNTNGFVILDLYSQEQIREFRKNTIVLIDNYKHLLPNRYFPVGQLMDLEFRKSSTQLIKEFITPHVNTLFKENSTKIHSGTHLIKPRGRNSFLEIHQDSAIVEEDKYNAILLWCPLQAISWKNGRLFVIKGSHKWNNLYRSTTIPWKFKNCKDKLYKLAKPLVVKEGQICLFHSALIHYSGYNFFSKYRIAVSSFISDKDAKLVNYFFNMEKNTIDLYQVSDNYYHNSDFNQRPNENAIFIKSIPIHKYYTSKEVNLLNRL